MKLHGRNTRAGHDSGFTLLEVLIAMAILGVGLLSIAVAQLTAIKVSSRSKNLQQAMFLAREQMDDLEALPLGRSLRPRDGQDPGNRCARPTIRKTTRPSTAASPSPERALARARADHGDRGLELAQGGTRQVSSTP
jgi:type IV pilus modification protein PilV